MPQQCTNCGAAIPAGAKFCPACGAAVPVQPQVAPVPPAAPRARNGWLIGVPIALLLLAIAGFFVLTGMPYSHQKKLSRSEQAAPPVINEQESRTATTAQIGEAQSDTSTPAGRGVDVIPVTTSTMPPNVATAAPPPVVVPQPQPVVRQPVVQPAPQPPPQQPVVAPPPQTRRAPATTTTAREINEEQAQDIVRGFVVSRDYYQAGGADCIGTASDGYSNRGYTIDVVDRCGDRGRLGRWRVDSVTREIFVQKADGRYLRP